MSSAQAKSEEGVQNQSEREFEHIRAELDGESRPEQARILIEEKDWYDEVIEVSEDPQPSYSSDNVDYQVVSDVINGGLRGKDCAGNYRVRSAMRVEGFDDLAEYSLDDEEVLLVLDDGWANVFLSYGGNGDLGPDTAQYGFEDVVEL